jgi:hypothetical protein
MYEYVYESDFERLLSAILLEETISLADWQAGKRVRIVKDKEVVDDFSQDETGQQAGRELVLRSDEFRRAGGGESISKQQFILLPTESLDSGGMSHVLAYVEEQLHDKGNIALRGWPGFGIEGAAYPAAWLKALPTGYQEQVKRQEQLGNAWIVYEIDGVPLAEVLRRPVLRPVGHKREQWYEELVDYIRQAKEADKTLSVEYVPARIKRFAGDLAITGQGDAVLIVSHEKSKAAYIVKKKMDVDGEMYDWDDAMEMKMNEFVDKKHESQTQAKLLFRQWVQETSNGCGMRRDFHVTDIGLILDAGVSYNTALELGACDKS